MLMVEAESLNDTVPQTHLGGANYGDSPATSLTTSLEETPQHKVIIFYLAQAN